MKRSVITVAFVSMLAALIWVFVRSAAPATTWQNYRPVADGSKLSVAKLGPTERVVIVHRSVGCFHNTERLFQIDGGPLRFGAKPLNLSAAAGEPRDGPALFGRLSADEAVGIDAYLLFLRHGFQGGCTTTDYVVVGYYRDGKKIGEERFQDGTCALSAFRWEKGRVVVSADERAGDFPIEVFRSIVPPWLIEERLNKPNQSPQPTQAFGQRG